MKFGKFMMCGIYFVSDSINNQVGLRQKSPKNSKVGKPTLVCNPTNNST